MFALFRGPLTYKSAGVTYVCEYVNITVMYILFILRKGTTVALSVQGIFI